MLGVLPSTGNGGKFLKRFQGLPRPVLCMGSGFSIWLRRLPALRWRVTQSGSSDSGRRLIEFLWSALLLRGMNCECVRHSSIRRFWIDSFPKGELPQEFESTRVSERGRSPALCWVMRSSPITLCSIEKEYPSCISPEKSEGISLLDSVPVFRLAVRPIRFLGGCDAQRKSECPAFPFAPLRLG